jgi:hypothetical protein
MLPADLPRLPEVQFDGGMVAIALALSMVAGAAFGIVPAVQVSGVNPGDNLKDAGPRRRRRAPGAPLPRRARRRRKSRSRSCSSSAPVCSCASFWSMLQVKPGLDPARVGFRADLDSRPERSVEEPVWGRRAAQCVHQRGPRPGRLRCPASSRSG